MAMILVILIGMTNYVYAQKKRKAELNENAWFIGAKGGVNIFFGDIKYTEYLPNFKYNELTFGYGFNLGKQFSPKTSLKLDVNLSKLSGTKKTNALIRTFDAKTQVATLNLQVNIFELFNRRARLNKLSVWAELGVGGIRWQSILYNYATQDTINLLQWGTKKYETSVVIPVGLYMRYYLNKNFSVDAHSSLSISGSDFLDAKPGGIEFDYYWYTGIGINYHFMLQSAIRNVPLMNKKKSNEIELLDYMSLDPFQDPEVDRITKKEMFQKEAAESEKIVMSTNPYRVEFWVPSQANHKKLQVLVSIKKRGITGNGYFRMSLPSGFYPVAPKVKEVTYTRIGYNYDFDFYLPMNKDTLNIPIEINISEREDGTYPFFIEGEVMNQAGKMFSIKNAQYVQISSGVDYNDLPIDQRSVEPKAESADPDYIAPINVTDKLEESTGDKTYRIQILACRKPSNRVNEFLKKHQIERKVYTYESAGWWRYSIYNLGSIKEAEKALLLVRNKHLIREAFIVEFENGERSVPAEQPSRSITTYQDETGETKMAKLSPYQKKSIRPLNTKKKKDSEKDIKEPKKPSFEVVSNYDNISVYRIEIAVSPGYPIPLRQLQNWVAKEKITEWTYRDDYRYTIGRFENEQVARAFLKYVRMQFALPDAHLVETKAGNWLKVVR
ncbi:MULTISPECIES: hypothetical protein [unclassified Lentimicrobium]|uniref:hypothetical protein n=1 Tax=unclassified Lentimicrobium TaxID=2677434 RepID=UPI0015532819|nr:MULTISPECIES: hypothetical protein [unclassified Lentimicrobium]NPD46006.1 hypothetical protein [Lentimicrobium sp. S6]NPD85206.1 hypothetical protein [Lentimicrobium sp. L6]